MGRWVRELATPVSWRELSLGRGLCLGLCGELLMGIVCPNTLFQRQWV